MFSGKTFAHIGDNTRIKFLFFNNQIVYEY